MNTMISTVKAVQEIIAARASSDGDGVKLLRVFGGTGDPARFDPFLMMDEFGSYDASDYIGGFPPHPHRGFETITYMLEGHMEHQDHMGNVGDLRNGDVQWMTAGAGIIHSEMPKQTEGRMRGFQVWLNLPSHSKMQPPAYRDIASASIPVADLSGIRAKLIAGSADLDGQPLDGLVSRPDTDPVYLDLVLSDNTRTHTLKVPAGHTALVYVYEGAAALGDAGTQVKRGQVARLDRDGDTITITPQNADTRLVVLAGKPLQEPIVQYGPFVMNTRQEIEQALNDYQRGELAKAF
ncbi:pirin family protein [Pseudohongiella sp.]|uniref:Quercetin 2,3-dioxygenase n=1 Tax=marine sediment metagenome TaxID=412755 RepID=A0A0F9VS90_9ZZZZ|nr:pirin family protein [Pseudohongiella sp.]